MEQHVIHDPVLRQRLSFQRSVDEDGGEVLHVEMWVEPGGGVPAHVHPSMEERFEVLAGRPSFLAGGSGGPPIRVRRWSSRRARVTRTATPATRSPT